MARNIPQATSPAQPINRPGGYQPPAANAIPGANLPANLVNAQQQRQHIPVRNSDLGQAGNAAVGSTAAAIGAAGSVAALAAVPSIAALAPFLTNPWTAPIAAVLAAGIVAGPSIYNKIRIANTDRKIRQHEKSFEKYSKMNPNDPKVAEKLRYHQEKLGMWQQNWSNITGKPYPTPIGISSAQAAGQAPLPQGFNPPNQIPQAIPVQGPGSEAGATPGQAQLPANLIQPNAVAGGGPVGQPGYYGGGAPENSFWGGTRAYTEQVPLFTPNQQAYQNQIIEQLRQNPVDFGAIRNEELRRFHEETAPQIANQYFGRNPNSFGSAYPEALGRGGASLGSRLAAAQAQWEAEREARYQDVALRPSYTSVQHPREAGFGENLATGLASTASRALVEGAGNYLSNRLYGNTAQTPKEQASTATTAATQQVKPVDASAYNQPARLSNFPGPYAPNLVNNPNALQQLLMKQAEASQNKLGGRTR